MSWFGRHRGVPSLLPLWAPFSSIDYYYELLKQVGANLDGRGLSHSLADDAVLVRVDGHVARLDLRALTQVVHARPVREWAGLVGQQVDRLLTGVNESAEFLAHPRPLDQVRDLLALRLLGDTAGSDGPEASGTVRPLVDGLRVQLVYRLPGTVATVPDEHPRTWAVPADDLVEQARANTRGFLRPVVAQAHETQQRYDVLAHASPLTASTLLCLEEVAGPLAPYGVLVGVPSVHELVAHVITGLDGAEEVMRELPVALARRHARVPEPLSPLMYWWRAGEVCHVPASIVGERAEPTPPAPLAEILAALP